MLEEGRRSEQMSVFERYVSDNWKRFARLEDKVSEYPDPQDAERYQRLDDYMKDLPEVHPYTLSIGIRGYVVQSEERVFLYISPYLIMYLTQSEELKLLYVRQKETGTNEEYQSVLQYVYEEEGLSKEERYILTYIGQMVHTSFNLKQPYKSREYYHAQLSEENDGELLWEPKHYRTVKKGERYEIYDTENLRFILQAKGFYDCQQESYIQTSDNSLMSWYSEKQMTGQFYRLQEQMFYHELYYFYREPNTWDKIKQRFRKRSTK